MVSVIGLINTSRHAFSSMVGDDMIIFLISAVVAGSNDRKPVRINQTSSDVVVFRSTGTRTLCLSQAATREKHWG